MAIHKPCPRCQAPMEIPQPAPDQIRCDKCGAIIKNRAASSAKQESVTSAAPVPIAAPALQPAPSVSRPNRMVLAGLVGGLLLVCLLPIAGLGLAWVFSDKGKRADDSPPPPLAEKKEPKEKKVEPHEPPMPPKIRAAIDKGAAHLKKRIQEKSALYTSEWQRLPDGDIGATALTGLALLEAKVDPQDPAIQEALARIREAGPRLQMIYALGSVLFFLNRLHETEPLNVTDRELVRSLALRLVAGQRTNGHWSYTNPPITTKAEQELLEQLRANKYKPQNMAIDQIESSSSMTQFALLALWGSRRHDIRVRPALLAAAVHFHQTQQPGGTWIYSKSHPHSNRDSNTCAGLIALAMEKTLREDTNFQRSTGTDPPPNPKADEQCEKAFAHLAKVIGRTKDDPITQQHEYLGKVIKADAWGDYYFLWCLERTAVIYDKKTIGGKDWYGWGSEVILQNQKEDGSWVDRHGDVPDTCFAILFLTRANLAKDLTESIRTRGGKAALP